MMSAIEENPSKIVSRGGGLCVTPCLRSFDAAFFRSHSNLKRRASIVASQTIGGAADAAAAGPIQNVYVDHRRIHATVAEKLLNSSDVKPSSSRCVAKE